MAGRAGHAALPCYSSGKVRTPAALILVTSLIIAQGGCRSLPEFGLPEQSPTFENFKPHTSRMVDMSEPGAALNVVRDVLDGSGPWRWTLQRPAVRVKVGLRKDLNYLIDFTLPEVTFQQTGPVTIAFSIDDHVLDRVRYDTPGYKHFEKAIPPEWLETGKEVIAGAEIDKVWVSKDDGARLGFILTRIGLTDR